MILNIRDQGWKFKSNKEDFSKNGEKNYLSSIFSNLFSLEISSESWSEWVDLSSLKDHCKKKKRKTPSEFDLIPIKDSKLVNLWLKNGWINCKFFLCIKKADYIENIFIESSAWLKWCIAMTHHFWLTFVSHLRLW